MSRAGARQSETNERQRQRLRERERVERRHAVCTARLITDVWYLGIHGCMDLRPNEADLDQEKRKAVNVRSGQAGAI